MSSINQLTAQQLRQAADFKDKITSLEKQLAQLVGSSEKGKDSSLPKLAKPGRKKISAIGIARIRAAQKARWAKIKGVKKSKSFAPKTAQNKRIMSAEARAKISAAAKARWAKVKAAKK